MSQQASRSCSTHGLFVVGEVVLRDQKVDDGTEISADFAGPLSASGVHILSFLPSISCRQTFVFCLLTLSLITLGSIESADMNGLRNVGTRVSLNGHAGLVSRSSVSTATVYRQLFQHLEASNIHLSSTYTSQSAHLLRPAPLRSKFLPHEVKTGFGAANARSFHHGSRLGQEKEAKSAPTEEPAMNEDSAKKASSENPDFASEEKSKEENAEENGGKKEEQKETPPPPPPHGDKSPWQVFRETMSSEFKASKEWNESTKALADGAQQFTENESVRRAREAYEKSTGAVSSTAGKVLKTTAGAVGKGAAWTWETPVLKAARTTVNATASVIEKGTRPIRETEAYKNVKNVIDDGSSSRYGGWVEKEERRKKRELWEKSEAERLGTGGRRVEVPEEDPL